MKWWAKKTFTGAWNVHFYITNLPHFTASMLKKMNKSVLRHTHALKYFYSTAFVPRAAAHPVRRKSSAYAEPFLIFSYEGGDSEFK